jgi:hypothetical protein
LAWFIGGEAALVIPGDYNNKNGTVVPEECDV